MPRKNISLLIRNLKYFLSLNGILILLFGFGFFLAIHFNYDNFKAKKIEKILSKNKYKITTNSGVIKFELDPLIAIDEVDFISNKIKQKIIYEKASITAVNNYGFQINPNIRRNCIKFDSESKTTSLTKILKTGDVIFSKDANGENCGEIIFFSGSFTELNDEVIIIGGVNEKYFDILKNITQESIKRNEILSIEKVK